MQTFYGTKKILARAMTRGEYNTLRGWVLPPNEDPNEAGFLVEYPEGGKPNVEGYKGYVSWSPADVFEAAYQPSDKMSFGHAIEAMERGCKVARVGWNGKGMWISLSNFGSCAIPAKAFWSENNAEYARSQPDGHATVLPCFTMKTATGEILMGWLASQTDMLAKDWCIVE